MTSAQRILFIRHGKAEHNAAFDEGEYDAEFHKARIFGEHVGEYMSSLKEEDPQEYERRTRPGDGCPRTPGVTGRLPPSRRDGGRTRN